MSAMSLQSLQEVFNPRELDTYDLYGDSPTHVQIKQEDGKKSSCCERDVPSYLDLSSNTIMFPTVKAEADEALLSWTYKHPEHWTSQEVLDWVYWVADSLNVDCTRLRGESFQNISGLQLSQMELEEFKSRDGEYGNFLYDMFKNLSRDVKFIEPPPSEYMYGDYTNYPSTVPQEKESEMQEIPSGDISDIYFRDSRVSFDGHHWYDIEKDFDFLELSSSSEEVTQRDTSSTSDGYGSSVSESDIASDSGKEEWHRQQSMDSDVFSDEDNSFNVPKTCTQSHQKTPRKRSSKSSKSSSCDDCGGADEHKKTNRGRKLGQASKGNHLWEFIRDLLKDTKFNPHLLRWEDKDSGVFRFVQSEAVAQMWGRKKNNPGMTYEKLSRAMRFCRSAGYFAEVPKNGKFPKKLCFRFGKKASGWDDS